MNDPTGLLFLAAKPPKCRVGGGVAFAQASVLEGQDEINGAVEKIAVVAGNDQAAAERVQKLL